MAWMLKPKVPTDDAFAAGKLVWTSTDIEVSTDLKLYVEEVITEIDNKIELKNTGFQKKKYRKEDTSNTRISIMLVGNLPFWLEEILKRLAVAMNGSGMILQFKDTFANGTNDDPITYDTRWINAGDFVENSELLNGGSMELEAFTELADQGRYGQGEDPDGGFYEETIDAPTSGVEWTEQIADGDADYIFYEVIG